MSDVSKDIEELNAALAAIAERAAADPAYRASLEANQAQALHAAGVSAFALAGVFDELGVDEAEVDGFGWGLRSAIQASRSTGTQYAGGQNVGDQFAGAVVTTTCCATCLVSVSF